MDIIEIGKVLKPQGIKGEIKILPITQNVNRFKKLTSVIIDGLEHQVGTVKIRDDGVYMTICGIDDRNKVEPLRGKYLAVPREEAIALPEDAWFIADLIGCSIFVDNALLGELTDIFQNGSADVYSIDHGKIMFPALKKVLKSVNVENKRIDLDPSAFGEVAVYED